jgi:pyridoxamine 5'-phosphate oxidase
MHLATAGPDGKPSGRIMLLRGFDENGFIFFTNYDSRKGIEIKSNNFASMTFFWSELFRQGRTHRLHDRIRYKLEKNNTWIVQRLYP